MGAEVSPAAQDRCRSPRPLSLPAYPVPGSGGGVCWVPSPHTPYCYMQQVLSHSCWQGLIASLNFCTLISGLKNGQRLHFIILRQG